MPTLPDKDAPEVASRPITPRSRYTRRHWVNQTDEARTCASRGCKTQLSRYNVQEHCSIHDGSEDPRA